MSIHDASFQRLPARARPCGWFTVRKAVANAFVALAIVASASAHAANDQPELLEGAQLIVCVAPDWDRHRARLRCFERKAGKWHAASELLPALIGKNGLAWGRGARAFPDEPAIKREGDGCSPAGVFEIGTIFGYARELPGGSTYPYHQVTKRDAWIDDSKHPLYNQHVINDAKDPPEWFERARMRLGDPAYAWLIEIRHNPPPAQPGAGSAIFLHIRRGPDRATTGCTVLAAENVEWIVRWLRPGAAPRFVALPEAEYLRLWREWDLPEPETMRNNP